MYKRGTKMKKLLMIGLIALISACSSTPKETYPYGLNEKEWNELSVKDKAAMRRDFYFYEKGSTAFVNPQMEVEGKKEVMPMMMKNNHRQTTPAPAPKATVEE